MEVDKGQKVIDDRMNDCWSFGSNCHPSSQPRKMSIGIMIDSLTKKKSCDAKDGEGVMPDAGQINSKRNSFEGKTVKAAVNANGGKESETTEKAISPWITKHQTPPISDALLHTEKTVNLPTTTGKRRRVNRKMNVPITHTVEFFSNQTSTLHGNNEEQNKFGGLTYERKGSKNGGSQRTEEFKFATTGDVPVSDKAVMDDKTTDRTTESLKKKLWEILGTVSSPKSQPTFQAPKNGADNSKQQKVLVEKGDVSDNPKQNSDTIETDSESPGQRKKRPVTRSLTRRRASNKLQFVKNSARPSSTGKQKVQQKGVFSFEGLFERRNVTVNTESRSTRKKSQTRSHKIEPRKILFTEDNDIDNIAADRRSKTSVPAKKTSSLSGKMGTSRAQSSHNKRGYIEAKNGKEERNPPESPARDSHKTPARCSHQSPGIYGADQPVDFKSTAAPDKGYQKENFHNSPLKNVVGSQHDFESPTFKMYTHRMSCSHSSAPATDQIKRVSIGPTPEITGFTEGNFHNPRNLQSLNADYLASDAEIDSADDAEELPCSPPRKSSPFKTKKNVEDNLSGSLSGDAESESTENGSAFIEGQRDKETLPEEPSMAGRSKFILHPAKRASEQKADIDSNFRASSPSPNVVETPDWMPESLEEIQEDELERNKMDAATRKKSSEILMSVHEEIQSQLQNIESQIQSDLGKLITLGKSKRKRLETRFQEQQERLKLLHDKFIQEIHQHLQEWQDTLEGQEELQNELKGTVKMQKASHQKLLAEVEETIARQINDAERRITAVNKLAAERLRQLGYAIAGCLNDGILG